MKYTGRGVREHILKMSGIASKLKKMDLVLRDEFLVHLKIASLPSVFEVFLL
jgi:BMFP domain-containing protein YqiC